MLAIQVAIGVPDCSVILQSVPSHPPEVKEAALAARRAGVGVVEVARRFGIHRNVITKWAKQAGIEGQRRPCGICTHPQRDEIDAALIENSVETVRRQFGQGLKFTMLDRHRRLHLGMPVGRGYGAYPACKICDHPDHASIDRALREGVSRVELTRTYEPAFTLSMLRNHLREHLDNPRRDAVIAAVNERRRQVVQRLAGRSGPPRGWFFCPECDSDNVNAKGSGDWKEDPGPVRWHVTECLDCGWPADPPQRSGAR